MPVYETRLLGRETVAQGTMSFLLERPAGFSHRAGQNVLLTLIDPPQTDAEGPSRTFTVASAPYESALMVATRMRDTAFKRVLKSAAPGLRLQLDGPNGDLVLHEDATRPAVFLAGGIGITPFLAMARQAAHEQLPHRLFLFYSNRRPEDAAFLGELQLLQRRNPNFRLIATMVEAQQSKQRWAGETGFIRREMLERHLPDLKSVIYYFAGPPAMTQAMHALLRELAIAEQAMRYEEFYGY